MTRRHLIVAATVGSVVLGFGALVGLAGRFGVPREDDDDDDEGQEGLVRGLRASKVSLQQGLTASEQEGQPIAGKFGIEKGKIQLSVYTAKDGKFSEIQIDSANGNVAKVEPITKADDLATAQSQSAAMAAAKTSLKAAVDKTLGDAAGARAVGVIPNLRGGHPVASVLLLTGERLTIVQQPLD